MLGVNLLVMRLRRQKTLAGQWGELKHQKTVAALVLPRMVQKIEAGAGALAVMGLAADSRDFQMVLLGHALHFQPAVGVVWMAPETAFRQNQSAFRVGPEVFQGFSDVQVELT